jgi:hypothetical protein
MTEITHASYATWPDGHEQFDLFTSNGGALTQVASYSSWDEFVAVISELPQFEEDGLCNLAEEFEYADGLPVRI